VNDTPIVLIDHERFYIYSNGAVQQLQRTEDSETFTMFNQLVARRNIYTEPIRWFLQHTELEIIFDLDNHAYTIAQHVDVVWHERIDENTWRSLWETQAAAITRAYSNGVADDEMLLRLLTEPSFVAEIPEWSDWYWPVARIDVRFDYIYFVSAIAFAVYMFAAAFAIRLVKKIHAERKARHATQSQNNIPV